MSCEGQTRRQRRGGVLFSLKLEREADRLRDYGMANMKLQDSEENESEEKRVRCWFAIQSKPYPTETKGEGPLGAHQRIE